MATTSVAIEAAATRAVRATVVMISPMFTDIATMSRPARAAVAPTIATLKSVQPSSASGMAALYSRARAARTGGVPARVRHIAGRRIRAAV